MARTILIDGANAVYGIFGLGGSSRDQWDQAATDFVEAVESWAVGQSKTEIEIIFDGGYRNLRFGSRSRLIRRARISFSEALTADAVILEKLSALKFYAKQATVVTQDQALAQAAMEEGAKVLNPDSFWKRMKNQ